MYGISGMKRMLGLVEILIKVDRSSSHCSIRACTILSSGEQLESQCSHV